MESGSGERTGTPERIGTALGFILIVAVAGEMLYAILQAVLGG